MKKRENERKAGLRKKKRGGVKQAPHRREPNKLQQKQKETPISTTRTHKHVYTQKKKSN
jgi:hypothetical protein